MAISHIGRLLKERAERETQQVAYDLLKGAAKEAAELRYYQGYAEGIKWMLEALEAIESEHE